VALDLDGTDNPRGIDLSAFAWAVMRTETRIAGGNALVQLTLRAATYAEGAVDDTPKSNGVYVPPDPPVTWPQVIFIQAEEKR
jgi:hypothetical protein